MTVSQITRERALAGWTPRTHNLSGPRSDEAHVWRARLSAPPDRDYRAILAPGERERADCFRLIEDRLRYTATRALLRIILGGYLGLDPHLLCFSYGQFGKPFLAAAQNFSGITFNVAHSGDYSLLAFGAGRDVGIDIEHLRADRNVEQLARAMFAPSRYGEFLARPEALRKKDFLQEWARREAVGKAQGSGISLSGSLYEHVINRPSEWFVGDIDAGGDYVAALAIRPPIAQVRFREWRS
jgi:4'-phosphopantetheinyl transferase